MRVLLAGPDFEENLSVRYLASSLQAGGHEPLLAAFNSAEDVDAVAEQARGADIVGLSLCFQSRAQEFLILARRIKQLYPGKLIVAGGHYASCSAEPLLEHHPELDIIVIHEGELTLVELWRLQRISALACRTFQESHIGRMAKFDLRRSAVPSTIWTPCRSLSGGDGSTPSPECPRVF